MNPSLPMADWELAFWRAFEPPPGVRVTQQVVPLPDGRTITGSLATVDGHGVRLVWQSARVALLTMARDPIESVEVTITGSEQTRVTTEGDPAAVATYVRNRLAAMT